MYGLAALALFASSCSSSDNSTGIVETTQIVERIISHCTDLDAPELGPGKLCIDNGFRVDTDDFTFSNWGRSQQADANVTVQTLVDLFGKNNVCAPGADNECILRPSTMQKLEEWNTALSAGRCEGLATLSNRFFLKLDHPSSFRDGAATVTDLQRDDVSLEAEIVYWWATQFLPEVVDRASASRQRTPLDLVDDLIIGLANSVGYTIGIYFESSGHAVTPFAVTRRDEIFVVHVYDNNFPGERREIFVDGATNTWSYPQATKRIDGTLVDWSGGLGTFELTPMSARKGPFRCAFCMTSNDTAPTTITLSSRDTNAAGYIYIASRLGTIEARPDGVSNTIDGATYSVSKGVTGGLVTVTLPDGLAEFDLEVRRTSGVVPAGDVVVGLQRPGDGLLQVSGDLAHTTIASPQSSSLLSVRKDQTTVRAPFANSARVSVAAGNTISRRSLSAGESMSVRSISETSIEISLKGSNGFDFGNVPIDIRPDETTREITLNVQQDGSIKTIDSSVLPVKIAATTAANFVPGKIPIPTTSSPTARPRPVAPSIEISEPD